MPYIDSVTNLEAAAGGAEAEPQEALLIRAPRTVRHRDRALTWEDYEDLAQLASPAVARAKCLPLHKLVPGMEPNVHCPGAVSVIIVPRSLKAKPVPSLELLRQVKTYLKDHGSPLVDVFVVAPNYVRVDVAVDIGVTTLEGGSHIERAVADALDRYLHPLIGGEDGTGWQFGRKPHKSDLYALLERVPGVDHVRSLQVAETVSDTVSDTAGEPMSEDASDTLALADEASARFLVYSGTHSISITYVADNTSTASTMEG